MKRLNSACRASMKGSSQARSPNFTIRSSRSAAPQCATSGPQWQIRTQRNTSKIFTKWICVPCTTKWKTLKNRVRPISERMGRIGRFGCASWARTRLQELIMSTTISLETKKLCTRRAHQPSGVTCRTSIVIRLLNCSQRSRLMRSRIGLKRVLQAIRSPRL